MAVPPDSRDVEAELVRSLREGRAALCPRCGDVLIQQGVPPRSDVAYVRDRIWLTCEGCRWSGVVDRRRAGPAP